MGILKVNKLKKGEKGLQQAIENNRKFEKNQQYKYDSDLDRAIGFMQKAKEGYSTEQYYGYDGQFRADLYYKHSFYKEGDSFVFRYETGYFADDNKKVKHPTNKYYMVIQKNEEGRYEISKVSFRESALGTITKITLGIGTDAVSTFDDGVKSVWAPSRKMTPEQEATFNRALESANKIEEMEIELNKKKDLDEVSIPKINEVKDYKLDEMGSYDKTEVEMPNGPEVTTPEGPEME